MAIALDGMLRVFGLGLDFDMSGGGDRVKSGGICLQREGDIFGDICSSLSAAWTGQGPDMSGLMEIPQDRCFSMFGNNENRLLVVTRFD